MFCPSCKAEYRAGFSECSDCGVALVVELPKPEEPQVEEAVYVPPSDYVPVAVVNGVFEEEQICSFLQASGIPARIRGEVIRKTYGITVDGIGRAEIVVPRQFLTSARGLLARVDRGELQI